jgi:hypothetical protein
MKGVNMLVTVHYCVPSDKLKSFFILWSRIGINSLSVRQGAHVKMTSVRVKATWKTNSVEHWLHHQHSLQNCSVTSLKQWHHFPEIYWEEMDMESISVVVSRGVHNCRTHRELSGDSLSICVILAKHTTFNFYILFNLFRFLNSPVGRAMTH